MCSRLLTSTLGRVNGDQSSVLSLKAVVQYMKNWFSKHEANMVKEVGSLGKVFPLPSLK